MEIKVLKGLLEKSYCPYSNFKVAAIAIDNEGKEYHGVNVENAAFPSGLCAERSALFGSVAYGGKMGNFKEIHIISSGKDFVSPCAGCRQVMTEFMPNDALVYQYNGEGTEYRVNKLVELIPYPIRSEQIK
ncbi:Cytidine deaminase (Cytidine aminohydrolase) [Mycoplasmopsis maculosa]|uniref:Cytidine deaminase n=1 Tax=Mycoplasmopsis maculosa TaxID=114885 RepID=A0A449B547_9BACT|nr:cytidine deaminase [Mycoplasmopsis maculosa]VEU75695.1 Cytidine deaminase (Cytidine aminohydrolase) [Mycoplasmopsis maculosa]